MKVLLLSEMFAPVIGGLEVHVQTLAAGLLERGHDVVVATMTAGPDFEGDIPVERIRSTTARMNPGSAYQSPIPDPEATLALRSLVGRFRPDVIHAHNWAAASAIGRGQVPLVLSIHDYSLACARRDLYQFGQRTCTGPRLAKCLSCAAAEYGRARGTAITMALPGGRRLLRPAAALAVSRAVADAVGPFLPVDVAVVPNFIPDEIGAGEVAAGLPELPFVMFAGVAGPHKGMDVLLDVWRKGLVDAPLLVATPRPGEVPAVAGVTAIRLERSQVHAAWRRAQVAVVPSIWPEPCATVILEALAAGTPVVATKVGGNPELVADGTSGRLVAPASVGELAAGINDVLRSESRRVEMGRAAEARSRIFRAATVIPRIIDMYRAVTA